MRPEKIGRVLGIGVRVAGRMAGRQLASQYSAGQAQPSQSQPAQDQDPLLRARAAGQATRQTSRNVARGVGGFLSPFKRVGGKIWLEVTGVFFLLPVIVFGPKLFGYWTKYANGSDRRTFPLGVAVVLVFLYLGVTSFWRARRR
jgi:hypothetical protein